MAAKESSIWDTKIIGRASVDSIKKLDPRLMLHNPVMFVVEVTSVLVTIILLRDVIEARTGVILFEFQIAIWLWFTVLFANFAEAMAEGRGKAQADNLRKTRTETQA